MFAPAIRILVCVLPLTLAACVPLLTHSGYLPEMQGGKLVRERCWGSPAIEYQGHGVVLTSRIGTWQSNHLKLEVQFDIPPGLTVTPLEPVVVVSRAGAAGRPVAIDGISRNGNPSLPLLPAGPMTGYALEIGRARPPGHFWLYVSLDAINSPNFSVTLPPLDINGAAVTIPAIHFSTEERLQLAAPLQC